jgi:hypothetical protein
MSPKKSRKPLDNALAQQFIYGEKQHGTAREPASEETPSEKRVLADEERVISTGLIEMVIDRQVT